MDLSTFIKQFLCWSQKNWSSAHGAELLEDVKLLPDMVANFLAFLHVTWGIVASEAFPFRTAILVYANIWLWVIKKKSVIFLIFSKQTAFCQIYSDKYVYLVVCLPFAGIQVPSIFSCFAYIYFIVQYFTFPLIFFCCCFVIQTHCVSLYLGFKLCCSSNMC